MIKGGDDGNDDDGADDYGENRLSKTTVRSGRRNKKHSYAGETNGKQRAAKTNFLRFIHSSIHSFSMKCHLNCDSKVSLYASDTG